MKIKRLLFKDGSIAYATEGTDVVVNKQELIGLSEESVDDHHAVKELRKKLKDHEDKRKDKKK